MSGASIHPGRPRDRRLDEAILAAALEVFLEHGYLGASLSEIARRAGVGTPAIYRRWPTKTALAIDVTRHWSTEDPIPDTGSIRDDLVEFLRFRIRTYDTPFFHQVMLPVLLEGAADPEIKDTIRERFIDYRRPMLARIRRSIDSGELREDTDANRLVDVLMGTVSMPLLFSQSLPPESDAEQIVDHVLSGFAGAKARNSIPD